MARKLIIPSIIAKNQKEFNERFEKIKDITKEIHLDFMDGKFVDNMSLMFNVNLPKGIKYEAHLMMRNPFSWIKKNGKKIEKVILHVESNRLNESIDLLGKQNKKIAISLNPKTPLNVIDKRRFSKIKEILIMSVNPGKYGATFLSSSIRKIKTIKKKYPDLVIEVDGSINKKTINKVSNAGADRFVVGSYLQKSEDVKKSLEELKRLIK